MNIEKNNLKQISNQILTDQENFFIKNKLENLEFIETIINNQEELLKKNLKNNLLKEAKFITNDYIEDLNLINQPKTFDLQKILSSNNLEVIKNNKIVAAKKIFQIGKKAILECNPFEYGDCFIFKNNFYYLRYVPKYNLILKVSLKPNIDYSLITNTLLNIPNLILIKNGRIIKGKINNNESYIFKYFKPLKIFYGRDIKYKDFENKIHYIIENIKKDSKKLLLKVILTFLLIFILFLSILIILNKKKIKLIDKAIKELKEKSTKDNLTGIYKREYLEEIDKNKYKTLLILDLDNFKYINDTYGHEKGDYVLKEISFLFQKYFKEDVVIRWGGDEFIIFTNKSKEELKEISKDLNKKIKEIEKSIDKKLNKLSISIGGCNINLSYEEKFKNADLALYKVKKTKKGNILFYDEIDYVKIENQ